MIEPPLAARPYYTHDGLANRLPIPTPRTHRICSSGVIEFIK